MDKKISAYEPMTFARFFKSTRRRIGLRQEPFAAALGVSQGCLSKIEGGRQKPGAVALLHCFQIAAALKARRVIDGLFEYEAPLTTHSAGLILKALEDKTS